MADIKPEQIPLEVNRAMRAAWARRNNSDAPEKHMADLAVAVLNAWPGMIHGKYFAEPSIILPLTEKTDDKA